MKKPFTIIAIAVLSLVSIVQLLRFILGWEVTLNGISIPVWASAIAFIVAAGLAVMVALETRR